MSEPVAVARGLGWSVRRREVLRDVDLDVCAGEVLGLCGPNGGGKSSLLLLLAGLVRPTAGEVRVRGLPAAELATARTGSVGLVTAQPGLYPLLTGAENLDFFGGLFGLSPGEVRARAAPLLAAADLGPHLDRPVGVWSSGMSQRLSLVRALLLAPALLLLDEPTANLDPLASRHMHAAVREQADRGVAVVLATHDLAAAEAICDRVAFLSGTVRHVETLDGRRELPPPGRLHALYRALEAG